MPTRLEPLPDEEFEENNLTKVVNRMVELYEEKGVTAKGIEAQNIFTAASGNDYAIKIYIEPYGDSNVLPFSEED